VPKVRRTDFWQETTLDRATRARLSVEAIDGWFASTTCPGITASGLTPAGDRATLAGMTTTSRPAVIADLVASLRGVLADDLVGLYVYGSLVTGGFDPQVSDLDLVAVTNRDARDLDLLALGRMHDQLIRLHPAWNDRIEIAYVGIDTVRTFRDGGSLAVVSPGEPLHLTDDAALWIQNWYLVRQTAIALVGPDRESVVPLISQREFVEAVARYAAEVGRRSLASLGPGSRAYAVLTMCRALRTVSTGSPCSKEAGATWTQQRHPRCVPLIEAALACRLSGGTIGFGDAATISSAEAFVEMIGKDIALITPREPAPRGGRLG
jgi:Domain of unknown function (DUF4111)/Nucleotidyltransferase domain